MQALHLQDMESLAVYIQLGGVRGGVFLYTRGPKEGLVRGEVAILRSKDGGTFYGEVCS